MDQDLKTNGALRLYTNEVSPEFLRTLNNPPFTEHQLAGFNEHALEIVKENQAYADAHPPIGIYRVATQGSQTRDGGVIQVATSPMELQLDDGKYVRAAHKGDYVVYADGTKAQIVTGSGAGNSHLALVGSCLSNGDEIINTPQSAFLLLAREGVFRARDFLPPVE